MQVSITFSQITNPSSTKPTESFVFYSQEEELGTYYSIDGIESGVTYSVSGLGSLSSITVTRDSQNSDNDGLKTGRATDFLFKFTLSNPLDEGDDAFTFIMPEESDAIINSGSSTFSCSASD